MGGKPLAVIRIGLSTALIASEARRSIEQAMMAGALGIALSFLGAMLAGRFLLAPIAIITSGVEQMAAGRDEVKLRIEGSDELGTLAEKFNQLSHRIKLSRAQWETERGQFFDVFRSISDAVLLLDSTGAILFANGEAGERLGLPAGGLAEGKPLSMLIGNDSPLTRIVETARTAGTEVHDVALELGRPAGASRVLLSIFALGRGPEPPGLLVVARDLESVKELESVIDYSGRLVRLGGLISGVAHQIRNPLNAMNLQLELLTQDAENGASVTPRIKTVRGEIERLDRAVEALLRFMRPEKLQLALVKFHALLGEVAQASAKPGIRLEYRLDRNVDTITADRSLLGEALRNIVSNAVDAMSNGGLLTLSTVLLAGGFVEVSISDQGSGIAPENLDRIFNLYFTTKKQGSGLGLPLALRAIDLHHGTVDVKSEPGVGTTFIIHLPVTVSDTVAPERQTA
jgi:signal transduction histidine kinase